MQCSNAIFVDDRLDLTCSNCAGLDCCVCVCVCVCVCLGVKFKHFLKGSLPVRVILFCLNCFLVGLLVVMVVDGGQWLGRNGEWWCWWP